MQKYVALLRGINVSGQKKIAMADLKTTLNSIKLSNVQTYIQSGNVVFESDENSAIKLADKIELAIQQAFGFDVPVLVIRQGEIQAIPEKNHWFREGVETKSLYVGFTYEWPDEDNVSALKNSSTGNDEYSLNKPFIFMKYADGIGKSKMDNNFFERKLKVRMTTRNWNTIVKLAGL
ncbi:MAG: DUF1697 domain-containing protein [Reichenbachiella sp.]